MKKTYNRDVKNLFFMNTSIFLALLLLFCFLTIRYSCQDKRNRILSSMEMAATYTAQEYDSITGNFWQAYMPVYETTAEDTALFQKYFSDSAALSPQEKNQLSVLLQKMMLRDDRISWIALYCAAREENYILQLTTSYIQPLPPDFPWLSDIEEKQDQMEIYGMHSLRPGQADSDTFAICGGVPYSLNGNILIGYHTGSMAQAASFFPDSLNSMEYYVISDGQVVYHSGDNYDAATLHIPTGKSEEIQKVNGRSVYVLSLPSGNASSYVVCSIDRLEMFCAIHRDTPMLLCVFIAFFAFSVFIGRSVRQRVAKEVSVIQEGLNILAENNLDYRLPTDFKQTGFPQIAQDINAMSSRLSESIQKAYYFELKQKDAEMAELQATFNPHFLYNTLEMLRNKSYGNGDSETADLIANLASIFRSFIGAKTFVTFREELAFSRKYLSLLVARYGDLVTFRYDIDSALLRYGIIRNVFQLLIENYFVHGFDSNRTDNEIDFIGTFLDEDNILVQVKDNGYGMTQPEIDDLNEKIQQPIRHSKENFGLKNLNQRLKLFYGPDYGLSIAKNESGGITVSIRIRKMTVEEYEKGKKALP